MKNGQGLLDLAVLGTVKFVGIVHSGLFPALRGAPGRQLLHALPVVGGGVEFWDKRRQILAREVNHAFQIPLLSTIKLLLWPLFLWSLCLLWNCKSEVGRGAWWALTPTFPAEIIHIKHLAQNLGASISSITAWVNIPAVIRHYDSYDLEFPIAFPRDSLPFLRMCTTQHLLHEGKLLQSPVPGTQYVLVNIWGKKWKKEGGIKRRGKRNRLVKSLLQQRQSGSEGPDVSSSGPLQGTGKGRGRQGDPWRMVQGRV